MKKKFKSLYWQIIFTVLAFTIMVTLSYMFNSRTVRRNLSRNAQSVLSFTREQIEAELISSKIMLGSFAQTVQLMIMDGNAANLQRFINITSNYATSSDSGLSNVNGLYGYFQTVFDEPIYIDGTDWVPPDDFDPTSRLWYKAAKTNCGEIVETIPYTDIATGQLIIS